MEADRLMMQQSSEAISDETSLEDCFVVGAAGSNSNRVFSQDMLGWVTLLSTTTKDTTRTNIIIPYPVWKAYMEQQIRLIKLKRPHS